MGPADNPTSSLVRRMEAGLQRLIPQAAAGGLADAQLQLQPRPVRAIGWKR